MSDRCKQVQKHLSVHWGKPVARHRLTAGRVAELPPEFEVLQFQRESASQVFSTCCLSTEQDVQGLELFITVASALDAGQTHYVVEDLTAVAHFHRTGARLGLGHTVNFGRPWLPGAVCQHALLSLPYLDGPKLEHLKNPPVRFLWLLPITERELEFKKKNGVEALERLFDAAKLDYANPRRASVV